MDCEDNKKMLEKKILFRDYDRKKKLQILKKIPDPFEPSEKDQSNISVSDIEKIKQLIENAKQGKSFIDYLKSKREFNNPENLQKVIEFYKIEEIGSNYPGDIYNPYSVVTSQEEYFDNINRKQNEIAMQKGSTDIKTQNK